MGGRGALALGEILKLELIEPLPATRITELWNSFHALNPSTVSKALEEKQYSVFIKNLQSAPTFTYPLLRKEGQFMLLSKYAAKVITFHHTVDYSTDPKTAEPYFTLALYEDLREKKSTAYTELALVRGEIAKGKISKLEAEKLLRSVLSFYLSPRLYQFVAAFNDSPKDFKHQDFLRVYLHTFA